MGKPVASAEEMGKEAAQFAARIAPLPDAATVLALSGDLGAGKTTFTQALARALGVEEVVASPTFVIRKDYALPDAPWQRLIHMDAYRLNGIDDLAPLRWDEIIADSANLVVIEWPEKVGDAIPDNALRIRFEIEGDGRIISIDGEEEN